jgi:hypothetical protein
VRVTGRLCVVARPGGGAYKYSELFKERLGVVLEKEDEMACLVNGCNFLLRAIRHEALTFEAGVTTFVPTNGAPQRAPTAVLSRRALGPGAARLAVRWTRRARDHARACCRCHCRCNCRGP